MHVYYAETKQYCFFAVGQLQAGYQLVPAGAYKPLILVMWGAWPALRYHLGRL